MNPRETLVAWDRWRAALGNDPYEAMRPRISSILGRRQYDEMPELTRDVCRLILVEPERARAELVPTFILIEEIVRTLASTDARGSVPVTALLAIVELENALACLGAPFPAIVEKLLRSWLAEIEIGSRRMLERVRVGLAALVLDDMPLVCKILGLARRSDAVADYNDNWTDLRPVLTTFLASLNDESDPLFARGFSVLPKIAATAQRQTELVASGALDEPTYLWLARFAYREVMQKPARDVAVMLRELIQRSVTEHEARQTAESVVTPPPFPHQETLAAGTYRVEQLLQGEGNQRLWLARRSSDGQAALVAVDSKMSRQSIADARAALDYPLDGGFQLAHVGHVDRPTQQPENDMNVDNHWLTVELVSRGTWLPGLLDQRVDRSPSTEMALQLGRSAGELLARAARGGRLVVSIRPEYLWATHEGGRWEVTGLTDRPETLFQLKRYSAFTKPVFDRRYTAPEWYQAPSERSVVYSLALMIHEWASRFPIPLSWHDWAIRPVPVEETAMPAPLKALLDEALRQDATERPDLASFLSRLMAV